MNEHPLLLLLLEEFKSLANDTGKYHELIVRLKATFQDFDQLLENPDPATSDAIQWRFFMLSRNEAATVSAITVHVEAVHRILDQIVLYYGQPELFNRVHPLIDSTIARIRRNTDLWAKTMLHIILMTNYHGLIKLDVGQKQSIRQATASAAQQLNYIETAYTEIVASFDGTASELRKILLQLTNSKP